MMAAAPGVDLLVNLLGHLQGAGAVEEAAAAVLQRDLSPARFAQRLRRLPEEPGHAAASRLFHEVADLALWPGHGSATAALRRLDLTDNVQDLVGWRRRHFAEVDIERQCLREFIQVGQIVSVYNG